MAKVAEAVAVWPHSSVAVQVTVASPVAPQRSFSPAKLWVMVTAPQLSMATGEFNQACS